jgi:enoyl-CoA hydratase
MFEVDVTSANGIARIAFQHPEVLNALGPADVMALAEALTEAGEQDDVRAVIVCGGAGAFSSGDNLGDTNELDESAYADHIEGFHELTRRAQAMAVPVVAGIDGVCIGGAFEFACSCDLRLATSRSRFGSPEVTVGLTVSNGGSLLLPMLVGPGYAAELTLTGQLIDAVRAEKIGLLNWVVEPDEFDAALDTLGARLAAQAPLAMQATKRLLAETWDSALRLAMARESAAGRALFSTRDLREGLQAFEEKRSPVFTGS